VTSPTARTLAALRKAGWQAQVVERWCAYSRRRIDLFGIIDIVACGPDGVLGVQATSGANMSARQQKARETASLLAWLASGAAFEIHAWRKLTRGKKRPVWEPNISRASLVGSEVVFVTPNGVTRPT
jgi:hypothetical protein